MCTHHPAVLTEHPPRRRIASSHGPAGACRGSWRGASSGLPVGGALVGAEPLPLHILLPPPRRQVQLLSLQGLLRRCARHPHDLLRRCAHSLRLSTGSAKCAAMGKRLNRQKRGPRDPKFADRRPLRKRKESFGEENMDDEIDSFHKQRDVVPIDVNRDAEDASDEDEEQPVFDFEGVDCESDDSDDGNNGGGNNDDTDGDDDGDEDDAVAVHSKDYKRMLRQERILQQKYGGVEDDIYDDTNKEEEQKASFGRGKQFLYGADNIDFEGQADEEDLAEEEAEAVELQKKKAKSLSMKDFGLEDTDKEESDYDNKEKPVQDIFVGEESIKKSHGFDIREEEPFEGYEKVRKDLNALSKDEQMDIVCSSAPELVGLLSELNEALNQLSMVKPLLCKVKEIKGAHDYLEAKQKLLLTYLQAISFYLLLKSEGHPVRDHPVIAHLVEIKNLWEQVKKMDGGVSSQVEEIINHDRGNDGGSTWVSENFVQEIESAAVSVSAKAIEAPEVNEFMSSLSKEENSRRSHKKPQNGQVGQQSLEMLKVRAILEEKLKKKGIMILTQKHESDCSKSMNRNLETLADFDDDVTDGGVHHGLNRKLHEFVPMKINKPMVFTGDDDLPKRGDIGEKRNKYDELQLRTLEKRNKREQHLRNKNEAGSIEGDRAIRTWSTDADTQGNIGMVDPEDGFYKEVKRQRLSKMSAKATLYSRAPPVPSLPETEADGKRHITYQMEKNKGLTRNRKKLTKIPRKKYKIKHQKAVVRRKGQVRDIRKPSGPYGGETSGINTRVSRSVRFKN